MRFVLARSHEGLSGATFFMLPKLRCAQKNCFKQYNKNKNHALLKMYVSAPNL